MTTPSRQKSRRQAAAVIVLAVLMVAGCSSDATGPPVTTSSSATGSPGPTSESVPASVVKDSVLDLNSTKDMTGVVTTVPIGQSPYIDHLPDVCEFIPDDVVRKLGATRTLKAFDRTELVTQGCLIRPPISSEREFIVNASLMINNIDEILSQESNKVLQSGIQISPRISATRYFKAGLDDQGGPERSACRIAWGTFYGAVIILTISYAQDIDACEKSTEAARLVSPLLPKSPIQMRATS